MSIHAQTEFKKLASIIYPAWIYIAPSTIHIQIYFNPTKQIQFAKPTTILPSTNKPTTTQSQLRSYVVQYAKQTTKYLSICKPLIIVPIQSTKATKKLLVTAYQVVHSRNLHLSATKLFRQLKPRLLRKYWSYVVLAELESLNTHFIKLLLGVRNSTLGQPLTNSWKLISAHITKRYLIYI